MEYNEIKGDLIALAKQGKFDVIAHGCNCYAIMGAGIAPQMAKAFGCDKYEMESWGPNIEKLGCIDYETVVLGENAIWSLSDYKNNRNEPELTVVNAYTQYGLGKNHGGGVSKPLDYEALTLCLRKMNHIFKGKHIGLPLIGCGLAGGVWDYVHTSPGELPDWEYQEYFNGIKKDVKSIIQKELKDCDVTIVIYEQ